MEQEIISILKNIEVKIGFQKEIFNIEDFCAYSGFTKDYVYKLTSSRAIKCFRPSGKMIFFNSEDVKDFLRQNPVQANTKINKITQSYLKK